MTRTSFLVTLFLIFALNCMAISSYSQTVRLNMKIDNPNLKEAMLEIKKQTEFDFLYSKDIESFYVANTQIDIEDGSIEELLNQLFANSRIDYRIVDKTIVFTPRTAENKGTVQQGITITGIVTDNSGDPLPGVTIMVKGTSQGTATDANGAYSLSVQNENAVLVFSYIGFTSQETTVGSRRNINVTLFEDTQQIDEVVVVGYGVQRKVSVTGSISSVNGEQLTKSPALSPTNLLGGRLSGVFANNRSGEPGSDFSNILIRGRSTLGTTSPLFVVDGVWGRGGYNEMDPNDIESITVLKDASAAIYGAQAANGVILITTKRGIEGKKPTINYTMNVALTQPTRMPVMANAAEYARVYNDLLNRQGQPNRFTEAEIAKFGDGSDPINYPDTDWINESLKNFSTQNQHNLSLKGGGNRVKYYVSGSYSNQNSILKKGINDYTTLNIRSNIDAEVTKDIKIALDVTMIQSNTTRTGPSISTIFQSMVRNYPYLVAYYPNGLPGTGIERGENPVAMATDDAGYRKSKYNLYQTTFRFDINIPWIKGLGIDGFAAYDLSNTFNKNWSKPWTVYNYNSITDTYEARLGGSVTLPQLTEQSIYGNRVMMNAKLKYSRSFEQHEISTFVAFEQSFRRSDDFSAFRKNYITDAIDQLYAGDELDQVANGSASETARRNFIGRLTYGFKDRYLMDFNFRYDGSSIFPKDRRWGFFPGISLAWRLSEEEFMKNISDKIDNLKIRASWGQMGNDQVSAFQYLSAYTFTNGYFLGSNSAQAKGLKHGVTPNPNITWEVVNSYNIAADLTMWNGLLGLTVDFFKTRRDNILTARNASIPVYTGLSLPNENIGVVDNKGFEIEFSHLNRKNDWEYSIAGNFSFARNKIIDIDEAANAQTWQMRTGHSMGTDLYYIAEGIYRTQAEIDNSPHPFGTVIGDIKYKDYNGDGEITANDRVRLDRTNIPEITYGLNLGAGYKSFDVSMFIQGQAKAWQYIWLQSGLSGNTLHDLAVNSYSESNKNLNSKYPLMSTYSGEISGYQSTFWLKDASFVRLKSLEIGYEIPQTIAAKFNVSKLRVYLNGFNLITIDKLKWFDPEGTSQTGGFYPQNKIFNLGLQLIF